MYPIIFNREMVRAILEDRKTQTRRIVKPQPLKMESGNWYPSEIPGDRRNHTGKHYANEDHFRRGFPIDFSPYGQQGNRLWVREQWRIYGWGEGDDWTIEYRDGTKIWYGFPDEITEEQFERWYIQCGEDCEKAGVPLGTDDFYHFDEKHPCPTRWRASFFLPRWASRITLEIVNVRVERLQEISNNDMKAEGIKITEDGSWLGPLDGYPDFPYAHIHEAFSALWDSINTKPGRRWEDNPWVWVIEFKKKEGKS